MAMKNRKRGSEDFFSSGYNESDDGSGSSRFSSPRKRPLTEGYQTLPRNSIKYPETISAFADGIKSDFFDIFSSGATALGSTVRMFFPMHSVDETTEDSLNDIEVSTPAGANKTPLKKSKSLSSPSPLKQKLKDSQAAIRMRCSNLWNEADKTAEFNNNSGMSPMPTLSYSSDSQGGLDEATHGRRYSSSSASTQAKKNNAKAQKGGKVLLAKLAKNPTIQYFACGKNDDKLIILGNLRMIHCVKNNDAQETATIIWCEKFQEIASCVISCSVGKSSTGKLGSKLDITTRDDNIFSVELEDAMLCIQVMQIIQQRCLPASAGTKGDREQQKITPFSNQSVDLLGLESFSAGTATATEGKEGSCGDMAPLSIGSSPKRTSSRRLVNKRPSKTKLMVNIKRDNSMNQVETDISKENCTINRLPPPPTASTSGVVVSLKADPPTKKRQEVNLIDFDDDMENSHCHSPAKKMKLANNVAVSSASTQKEKKDLSSLSKLFPATLPLAQSSTSTSTAPAPLLPPPHLKKYSVMLKSGVPLQAVQQKMALEGVSEEDMRTVSSSASAPVNNILVAIPGSASSTTSAPANDTASEASSTDAIPAHLKKYQIMMKSGVPQNAVKQKMTLEGMGQDEINLVFGIKSPEISPALKKFQVMLKSGIPPGAVEHKMIMEGVSTSDQALVLGKKISTNAATAQVNTPKVSSTSGPQLLGLHWDPISENNDSLALSMWGDIHSETSSSEACSKAHHQLQEKEFDSLSSMFSRKATPAKSEVKGHPSAATSDRTLRSKSKMPTTIDMSRSTNISIGMSSFKQKKLTTALIVQAINMLDISVLNHEDLSRLVEILPSDTERKTFSGKISAEKVEGFHDTEKWLHQLSAVENCKEKVDSMIFMTSYAQHSADVSKDLQALVSFTELVVASAGLKEVMKCILAIGNSLNQGTYKGAAKGFRLASLLKLQQTKSTDGKSTVMDYLVQVLHSRYVTGDLKAGSALSLNDELCDVNQVKNINVKETSREVSDMKKQFEKLKVLFQKITDAKDNNLLIDTNFENATNESNITQFIAATETSLTTLEELQNLMTTRCSSIIQFFGEEEGSSVQQMYSMLAEFIAGYAQSKRKFEDNLRKESRLKAAAAKKASALAAKK